MSHVSLSTEDGNPVRAIHIAPLGPDRQHLIDRFVELMSGPTPYKEKMAHPDALLIMQFSKQECDRVSIALAQRMSNEELESTVADTRAFEEKVRQGLHEEEHQ
jgi:hypothetical protein